MNAHHGGMRTVVLVAMLAGCSNSAWNRATLATSTMLIACDGMQTLHAAGRGWSNGQYEGNMILGRAPTVGTVSAYFLTAIAVNTAVWALMPERYKSGPAGVVTAYQANQVSENYPTEGVCGLTTGPHAIATVGHR